MNGTWKDAIFEKDNKSNPLKRFGEIALKKMKPWIKSNNNYVAEKKNSKNVNSII